MMGPLYVSFVGNRNGQHSWGWVVFGEVGALSFGADIEELCKVVEKQRGYDRGTVVVINFCRLENRSDT